MLHAARMSVQAVSIDRNIAVLCMCSQKMPEISLYSSLIRKFAIIQEIGIAEHGDITRESFHLHLLVTCSVVIMLINIKTIHLLNQNILVFVSVCQ